MSELDWIDIFADNLRTIMDEQGITQRELAYRSNLADSTISYYIHGIKIPSVKSILALSYALNVNVNELIDFGDVIND